MQLSITQILILKCPSSCIVHKAFTVTFHIFNLDRHSHKIWLSIDKNSSGYLAPCNISKKYLGILEPSTSIKTDMSLIAFAPGIHVLTGIVIETQRLNTISSLTPNSGKLQSNTKRIQYESTQYIYIDISEEFHQKKLREKKQLELRQLEMQKKQNENEVDMEEVDMNIGDDEKEGIDDNEDEEDENVGIEQQMKHRGSMELNMNETMNFDEEENEEQKGTDDQDKEKLISEMKPIGHHQKSEDQILKEMIQEEQTEIQSMTPLESTDHADFDKNEEQNEEEIQDQNVNDDVLDVPPLEIQQQEEEKQSHNDAETQQENTTV